MIAVVVVHVVAVPVGSCRSVDRDGSCRLFSTGRLLRRSTDTCAGLGFRESFWMFFAYKKCLTFRQEPTLVFVQHVENHCVA